MKQVPVVQKEKMIKTCAYSIKKKNRLCIYALQLSISFMCRSRKFSEGKMCLPGGGSEAYLK